MSSEAANSTTFSIINSMSTQSTEYYVGLIERARVLSDSMYVFMTSRSLSYRNRASTLKSCCTFKFVSWIAFWVESVEDTGNWRGAWPPNVVWARNKQYLCALIDWLNQDNTVRTSVVYYLWLNQICAYINKIWLEWLTVNIHKLSNTLGTSSIC